MADLDMAWMGLGLFLLACGGLPAVMAYAAERRRRPHGTPALFQEEVHAAPPAELDRLRAAVAPARWRTAHPSVTS